MSNCNFSVPIDENQCIGDSLDVINGNFKSLDTAVCNLSAYTVTSVQTFTPELTSTQNNVTNLSGDFLTFTQTFTPELTSTQNNVTNLSGYFIGQINTILAALSSLDPTDSTTLQAGLISLSSLELP